MSWMYVFLVFAGPSWVWQAVSLLDLTMFRKKKKKRPEISTPKNFEHRVHTSFDAKRCCFVGLPTQWHSLIENLRRPKPMVDPSRITSVELKPKKVLDLILSSLSCLHWVFFLWTYYLTDKKSWECIGFYFWEYSTISEPQSPPSKAFIAEAFLLQYRVLYCSRALWWSTLCCSPCHIAFLSITGLS